MADDGPAPLAVSELLQLDPTAFVEDLYNAAHCHCADAFDEAVRRDLGPALSLAQQEQIMQATAALYDQARAALSSQLQRFEEFALETCLCIPPGLVTSAQAGAPSTEEHIDPEEEAAVQGRLVALRKEIAADKEATRVAQRRLAACEAVLRPTDTTFDEGLSRLAASLQEKETASGDVFVLSQSGARLESLLSELRGLMANQPRPGPVEKLKLLAKTIPSTQLEALKENLVV
ncbi:hypothetical protein QBZ16_002133 [Prototheca wickerhamii]|uniref:Uncharacterized protein n=1 Tax=Prototheca wickerhamii TaxID=3111 RepID=A0AAD9ILF6_PROWI|nr:hypothetical protein QBZ16_002133 [Prototheca wickerhamii]